MLRTLAAAGLALALVLSPAAAAQAADPPPPSSLPGSLGKAADLMSYKVAYLGPTLDQMRSYNPGLSDADLRARYNSVHAGYVEQRQSSMLGRYSMDIDGTQRITDASAASAQLNAERTRVQTAFKTPSFPAKKFEKVGAVVNGVGGALATVTALPIGFQFGNDVVTAFGYDVDGLVCSQGDAAPLLSFLTAADCDLWAQEQAYVPNVDVAPGVTGASICRTNAPTECAKLFKVYRTQLTTTGTLGNAGDTIEFWCFHFNASWPTVVDANGARYTAPSTGAWRHGNNASCTGTAPSGQSASGYLWNLSRVPTIIPLVEYGFDYGTISKKSTAPIVQDADPERTYTCEITGTDGMTYSATSEPFRESSGQLAPPVCPDLPDDVYPAELAVRDNGSGQTVYDEPVDPHYQSLTQQFPECMSGLCTVDLIQQAENKSCFELDEECKGWINDPNRETNYRCIYSGQTVPIAHCFIYGQTFDADLRADGFAYSDPLTGELRFGATSPNTREDALAADASIQDCVQREVSAGDFWGIIFSPVRCALVWAFVPSTASISIAQAEIENGFEQSPPGQIMLTVGGFDFSAEESGCAGIPFSLDWFHSLASGSGVDLGPAPPTVYLLSACPGDLFEPWALIVKLLIGGGIVFAAIRTWPALVGRLFGYSGIDGR